MSTALPIVPQDSTDPGEILATRLARLSPLPHQLNTVLEEIEDAAREEGIPVVGRLEGVVLRILAGLHLRPGARILDIGTAVGYSALWLAQALPDGGQIVSIEIDPQRAARAKEYIARAGCSDRIEVMVGDAFDLIPGLGVFDLVFQDVMKHHYFSADPYLAVELLKLSAAHMAENGLLIIDNAFCGGNVLQEEGSDTVNEVIGVRNLNDALAKDPDFQSVILPIRDGMWLARRTGADARRAG
jgi:caffeoyl-CoA O-methyltransferase